MRIFKILSLAVIGIAEVTFFFSFAPRIVSAETRVSGEINGTHIWDRSGSPYIFDGEISVTASSTLYVGPGVSITANSKTAPPRLSVSGELIIDGSSSEPVDITGLDDIWGMNGKIEIKHAFIHDGPNIGGYRSALLVSSSTITNSSSTAFYVWGSSLHAWDLQISNMDSIVFGLTSSQSGHLPVEPDISLSRSALIGNPGGINNIYSNSVAHAENNWWGSAAGPIGASTTISGQVSYEPWLLQAPALSSDFAGCCSSILFLPGLEASRLYFGSNQLWEPNRNRDVESLFMDSTGSSTNTGIYSGLPIDSALHLKSIYGKFMEFLGSLTSSGAINEWRAFGYDWRKPINEVVLGIEKKATTTESLIEVVEHTAARSRTGKVTIIAHSNGGLVAKYLVKSLEELGKTALIDNVISVAVPYLGTPQAISGLLHGDDQSMLAGLILSASNARQLGINMASAYSLLPSVRLFEKILSPTIAFASTTIAGLNDGSYPKEINNFDDQKSFLVDEFSVRKAPAKDDLLSPIIGNSYLVNAAEFIHGLLDPFVWPQTIARWAFVGWNNPTTRGILYSQKSCGTKRKCAPTIEHANEKTVMGDGTVVAESADYESGQIISADLAAISQSNSSTAEHANILENKEAQSAIEKIIRAGASADTATLNAIAGIPGLAIGEPDYSNQQSFVKFSTHSPVELHVYDSKGRHTGLLDRNIVEGTEDNVISRYETNIPGSSFEMTGNEGDKDTQIWVPNILGEYFLIVIKGNNFGHFVFDVEQYDADKVSKKTRFMASPVTPLMIATTTYKGIAKFMHVDFDGDGQADFESAADYGVNDPESTDQQYIRNTRIFLKALADVVEEVMPGSSKKKALSSKLNSVARTFSKETIESISDEAWDILKYTKHLDNKSMTENEKQALISVIEKFAAEIR